MMQEKFTELLDKCEVIHMDLKHSEVIIYGTRGYGKSHLLAALVCYLAAEEQKVIYTPDCQNFICDLVQYMISAMLFSWADNESKQQIIMALDTQKEIYQFFWAQKDVIFVINQLNTLEKEKDDNKFIASKKAQLHSWLQHL
jgi:predicted AAA+ superfamily ATPase